jgi:hypothetical protein
MVARFVTPTTTESDCDAFVSRVVPENLAIGTRDFALVARHVVKKPVRAVEDAA